MKKLIVALAAFTTLPLIAAPWIHTVEKLHPSMPAGEIPAIRPGEKPHGRMTDDDHATDVAEPSLVWVHPEKPDGRAIIVCPGGGYSILSSVKEGTRVAKHFADAGVTAAVLLYRVPTKNPHQADAAPRIDLERALVRVREEMAARGFPEAPTGAIGFSAGGHLVLHAGYGEMPGNAKRPDFVVAVYPAYLTDKSGALKSEFKPVKNSPPACFIHAADDPFPASGSVAFREKLHSVKVPTELHLFSAGGHGYGISPRIERLPIGRWPDLVTDWLNLTVPAPKR